MKFNYSPIALSVVCALTAATVTAQTQRDLDSHEHGAAMLNVVVDGSTIFIEMESPWANLVGFEHQPSTDEQRDLLSNAIARLEQADSLFMMSGDAGCIGQTSNMVNTLADGGDHDDDHDKEHGHDDDHDDDHDKEHGHDDDHDDDHDKEHGHDDDHDDDHDEEHGHDDDHAEHNDTHSEILVEFTFNCDDIDAVEQIVVAAFEYWPGFEELNGQLATASGQTAFTLTAQSPIIDLTSVR